MSIVKDPNLAATGNQKIEWVKSFMPVLSQLGNDFAETRPFDGLRIGMSIHLEAKTAFLALTLKAAGAEVFATGCNPLSTQDDVAAGLASQGVEVFAIHDVDEETYEAHLGKVLEAHPDLIIDDGGDLLGLYCRLPESERFPLIGGCEETTTGVHRLKARALAGQLPFPMVDINDAKSKHFYDNRYGTGQSVWDAIMHTTNTLIAGKTVVVAGYGYCGRGIALRAKGLGANVIITEIDPVKELEASMDGYQVMSMYDAAPLGNYFITATGCRDVITGEHFWRIPDNAFLANAGHFDVEINLHDLAAESCEIFERRENITGYVREYDHATLNLLAKGRLVNLAAGNGHPAEIMDMSFALQTLGLKFLVDHRGELENVVYDVPEEIDDYVAQMKRQANGLGIDQLTPAQQDYLNSWEV